MARRAPTTATTRPRWGLVIGPSDAGADVDVVLSPTPTGQTSPAAGEPAAVARPPVGYAHVDRHLAWTGYASQQYDGPVEVGRPDNLWEPIPDDHGAHGAFDDRAHERSVQLVLVKRRSWVTTAITALAGAGGLWLFRHARGRTDG